MQALKAHENQIKKLLRSSGIDQIGLLHTIKVSWSPVSGKLPEGATLTEALRLLHVATGRMIVLIVDEAQHALDTPSGINSMYALKAARDAMILGMDTPGLRLIFTGSSRDKLAQLVLNRKQPFFGAQITPFPLLGLDFIKVFTAHINDRLAADNGFRTEDVMQAFTTVGHRPELLWTIVRQVALELGQAPNLGELLAQGALDVQAGFWPEYEGEYALLSIIQRAVLEVMATRSVNQSPLAPFAEKTIREVSVISNIMGSDTVPTAQSIQSALEALREKGIIWRSGRGVYALEDSGMADWLISARAEHHNAHHED